MAQEASLEDYLQSHRDLKALGLTHMAVGAFFAGGRRALHVCRPGSAAGEPPHDWLVALGTFHLK